MLMYIRLMIFSSKRKIINNDLFGHKNCYATYMDFFYNAHKCTNALDIGKNAIGISSKIHLTLLNIKPAK